MISMLTEEYCVAKKKAYDEVSKAFEEKYYGGGKIAEGLTAAQAGNMCQDELHGYCNNIIILKKFFTAGTKNL